EHILELFTSWEEESHLYMQTDFCENGSLDVFLQDVGQQSRLDEFRVWKVLTELCLGVSYIHDAGFLHLDLKPANILVTFEGVLKIGDFGMSCAWPAPAHTEREGDREYIAPEVLSSGIYDKPVDIFSLGLMIFEVAANIVLPDNGTSWQKLRSGDLSDAPRLSSSDEGALMIQGEHVAPHRYLGQGGLDRVVKWMLSPDPSERPTAVEVLNVEEVVWANRVRKAGAIIFEGDRGP
ncbi:kinase-like domain-containing protein, partial [Protomyces lactucae-debilis]